MKNSKVIFLTSAALLSGCYKEDLPKAHFLDHIQNPTTEVLSQEQGQTVYAGGSENYTTEVNTQLVQNSFAFLTKVDTSAVPKWTRRIDCTKAIDVVDAAGQARTLTPVFGGSGILGCSIWGIAPDPANNVVFAVEFRYQNIWSYGTSLIVHKLDSNTGNSLWEKPRLIEGEGWGLGAGRPMRTSVVDGKLFILDNQHKDNGFAHNIASVTSDGTVWTSEVRWTEDVVPAGIDDGKEPLLSATNTYYGQMRLYSQNGKRLGELFSSVVGLGLRTTFKAGDNYYAAGLNAQGKVVARRIVRDNGTFSLADASIELGPEQSNEILTAEDSNGGTCYAINSVSRVVSGYVTKEGKLAWSKTTLRNGDDIKLQNVKSAEGRCFTMLYNDTYTSKKPSVEVRLQTNGSKELFFSGMPFTRGSDIATVPGAFWMAGVGGKHLYRYSAF